MKTAKILAFIGCLLIASCGIKNGKGETEGELISCKDFDTFFSEWESGTNETQIQQINATLFVEKGVRKPLKLQRRKSKKCDFSLFAKKCLSLRSFQKTKRWSI